VGIILKLRLTDDSFISITPLIRTTKDNKAIKNLIELCKVNLDIRYDNYELSKATHIMFSYHIFDLNYNQLIEDKDFFEINLADKLNKEDLERLNNQIQSISVKEIKNINFMSYAGFKLPLNYANMERDFFKLNPKFILDKNYHNEFITEHLSGLVWKYKIVHKLTSKNKLLWIDTKLENDLMKRTIGKNVELIIDLKTNKIRIIDNSIKEGYIFEAKNIFEGYISDLFAIKQSVIKSNPWYPTSKLLMNSLYGRFGLKNILQEYNLLNINEIETFLSMKNIECNDILDIEETNKAFIISDKMVDGLNSSLPIASAVTAYARMKMAPILLDESIKVLYTDTDSFVIEGDLKLLNNGKYSYLLHNNLGGLKLETIFS
jgi:hypothetical protein